MNEHNLKYRVKVKPSSDRVFGIFFACLFFIVGMYPIVFGGPLRLWSLLISFFFLLLAFLVPSLLGPLNHLWMRLGFVLHLIVSPIALGFIFFCSVLPVALFLRIAGKDSLHKNFDPKSDTYWITRNPPGPTAESFNNQF